MRTSGFRIFWVGILVCLLTGVVLGMEQGKPGENAGAVDPHAGMGKAGEKMQAMEKVAGLQNSQIMMQQLGEFYNKQDRTAFEQKVELEPFSRIAIQHNDQVKLVDSWARQSLRKIRNRQTLEGKPAVLVVMDMAIRPEAWLDKNIIYVQAVPVREQLARLAKGKDDEAKGKEGDRIMKEGLVSPAFLSEPEVERMLEVMQTDTTKSEAVGKVFIALRTFQSLGSTLNILPPVVHGKPWLHPIEIAAPNPGFVSPYPGTADLKIKLALPQVVTGWQENDPALVNSGLKALVELAPALSPSEYPSETKRTVELWYNRTFSGTLVAFVYFGAMALFLMVAVGITKRVEKTALVMFGLALALHAVAMGVRWWLAGRIPIQNQFESVMGSALAGCTIGLALEGWKRNGIFGVAFSFVGFLAMTACLASPYVFGHDLGAAVGPVAAILSDAWLYIHVNIVIASYALIFAAAVIGAIYLGIRLWHWINPIEPGAEEMETRNAKRETRNDEGAGGGGTSTVLAVSAVAVERERSATLEVLDQANMVVLQMAFWFLGIGIICGAVWADHSWGRPWGWDPKETFALVTWIVYLIIVHLRFVTKSKGDWSAALAVVGCVVMLFNWIGVNFFLQGLHSYA